MTNRREFLAVTAGAVLAAPLAKEPWFPRCSHCNRPPEIFSTTIYPGMVGVKCCRCSAIGVLDSGMPWITRNPNGLWPRTTPDMQIAAGRNIRRLGSRSETARFLNRLRTAGNGHPALGIKIFRYDYHSD